MVPGVVGANIGVLPSRIVTLCKSTVSPAVIAMSIGPVNCTPLEHRKGMKWISGGAISPFVEMTGALIEAVRAGSFDGDVTVSWGPQPSHADTAVTISRPPAIF